MGDRRWFWLNTRGLEAERALHALLPGKPDAAVQAQFTGSVGRATFYDGWQAYRLFKALFLEHSDVALDQATVLDFGCGWGRIIRFFLKDVDPTDLWGADCDSEIIRICTQTNRWCNFEVVDVLPPSGLPAQEFDLIYCFSVFSHLSREAHDRWLEEFSQLLKPGGVLIATTWPRDFIERCARLRTEEASGSMASHLVSGGAFLDTAAALAEYDAGGYCFSDRTPDDPEHFGEACIPEAFVRSYWSERFEICEYIADPGRCPQNVIVARKPDPAPGLTAVTEPSP